MKSCKKLNRIFKFPKYDIYKGLKESKKNGVNIIDIILFKSSKYTNSILVIKQNFWLDKK